MAPAMENGMKVTMTEIVLGRIWLNMTRVFVAPRALAAVTYSRAFSL